MWLSGKECILLNIRFLNAVFEQSDAQVREIKSVLPLLKD